MNGNRRRFRKEDGTVVDWFKSIPEGAATQVWVATHPDNINTTGIYCEDCNLHKAAPHAEDAEAAARLWQISEEWTGVKFEV